MTSLYGICLATAIAVFLAGVCYSAVIFSRNRKTGGKPAEYLTLSVFISSAVMFVPLYADELPESEREKDL